MQVNTRHNYEHQLRDILHIIATTFESEPCVSLILQTALQSTGAAGAAYQSFVEPILNVTLGESAVIGLDNQALANLLKDSPILERANLPKHLLICSVGTAKERFGVFWLTFNSADRVAAAERDLLTTLADALMIVITRAQAHDQRAQERRLALSVLHSITDPLLVFDENWHLLLANPAAEIVFGAGAVVGSPLSEVVRSDEVVAFVEGKQPLNEWGSGEKTFVPRVQPVRDADDQPDGWILALRDITQFKKLNRNQSEFVRIVSHDLRSPLTSMQGFTSMLGMVGELNERQAQFVEKVLSGIAQIAALVENIQDAGRFDIETGFYEMTRSHCDLSEMVNRIVNNHLVPAEKQELRSFCLSRRRCADPQC